MMFVLACFDTKETYFAYITQDDTIMMIEQIVLFFLILVRVIHIPVLVLFCLFCAPCQLCPDDSCIKKWQNSCEVSIENGIYEEIEKQKWVYNSKKDQETLQKLS